LGRIADAIDQHHERLARIESEDTGKPLSQALDTITATKTVVVHL
jgi:acyl-CoA reductase-like NAD-dependent aldehyde dehydrogenase